MKPPHDHPLVCKISGITISELAKRQTEDLSPNDTGEQPLPLDETSLSDSSNVNGPVTLTREMKPPHDHPLVCKISGITISELAKRQTEDLSPNDTGEQPLPLDETSLSDSSNVNGPVTLTQEMKPPHDHP